MIPLLTAICMAALQTATIDVPESVLTTVGDLLPEQSSAGAAFVAGSYSPNVIVTQDANIEVVFIWEGAGYRNSFGWFSFVDNADGSVTIVESNLIMPDASFPPQGASATGDTFTLTDTNGVPKVFTAGDKVGFFVVADGWNMEPLIQNFTSTSIPSSDPVVNAGFGRGCYTSIDKLNPEFAGGGSESARHLAMIWLPAETGFLNDEPFLLSGFEDLRRDQPGCDNDFNDLVFIVTASPIAAIDQTPAFNFAPGDPDGDGIVGLADSYPNDASRAFLTRYPATGERVIACEDRYPWIGDADYNDIVLAYHLETVTDAAGLVKDLLLTVHLVARGATYEHSVGWHIPGIPSNSTGTVSVERFLSDSTSTHETPDPITLASMISEDSRRVPDLFAQTSLALPPPPGNLLTNTYTGKIDRPAASARVKINFDTPVSQAQLGSAPYDLYFSIFHAEERWDVHLPGHSGFPERPGYLPNESGASSYLDDAGNPWMLDLPTNWMFPMEQIAIWNAYPDFSPWVEASGNDFVTWYQNPATGQGFVSEAILEYVPARTWSVSLPQP